MNNANPNALDNVSELPKFALSMYYMHIFTNLVQANTFTLGSNERPHWNGTIVSAVQG